MRAWFRKDEDEVARERGGGGDKAIVVEPRGEEFFLQLSLLVI
mgnify:CR=1 FL=1